ncbi:MAG: transketolase [Anaerolineae bacterium]
MTNNPTAKPLSPDLERLCINTIRTLSMDAIQKAGSGHPGMPMGIADAAFVLWTQFLKHYPPDPTWPDRDRFVLSAGHGSMVLYALLYLTGYDLTLEDIKQFRQWGSKTPGHPEFRITPGVEATTGPLGQGFGMGVGMAMAERFLAQIFNQNGLPIVDHSTYAIVSDGDLMEGISHEAASLAGHLGLGRLIYLYDCNRITIEGSTDLTFTEDVGKRFQSYGWQVVEADGHDPEALHQAIGQAREDLEHPSLIICHTHIAYGSPNKQDCCDAHGMPLGEDEVRLTKRRLGWPEEAQFLVPEAVRQYFAGLMPGWKTQYDAWQRKLEEFRQDNPDLAKLWHTVMAGKLPEEWKKHLPTFAPGKSVATRNASGEILNAVAPHLPTLLGGSADLASSTKTWLNCSTAMSKSNYGGRNIHWGVREHAMGAAMNGMVLHGGVTPYGATFTVFADYMRPSIRLAALMRLPTIFLFLHDSVFLGEDGPTHQPVEHFAAFRAMPNLTMIRPADANETAVAWAVALERRSGPTALILSRQEIPVLEQSKHLADGLRRGAYVLIDAENPDLLLIGSGSEVWLCIEAHRLLLAQNVRSRVVSMPSWELFEEQPQEYKDSVLPPSIPVRLAVEAAVPLGWEQYIGPWGGTWGIVGRYGASAPWKVIAEKLGFTPENVAAQALGLLEKWNRQASR